MTLQETVLVLAGFDQKPHKDHLDAVDHKGAFLYVQELVHDKIPFWKSSLNRFPLWCSWTTGGSRYLSPDSSADYGGALYTTRPDHGS